MAAVLGVVLATGLDVALGDTEPDTPPVEPVLIDDDDFEEVGAYCRGQMGVSSRDVDGSSAITSKAQDTIVVGIEAGSESLVCVRAVVDGQKVDTSYDPEATTVAAATPNQLLLLRNGSTRVVVGALYDRVREAPQEGTRPVYLQAATAEGELRPCLTVVVGAQDFFALTDDVALDDDRGRIVLTLFAADGTRTDLGLGDAEWADLTDVG